MRVPTVFSPQTLAVLALAATAAGCSSVSSFMSGEKIDYKSQAKQTGGLEVPPDLTQLAKEGRYQPPAAVVSAAAGVTQTRSGTAVAPGQTMAAAAIGDMKIVRDGNQRWLSVPLPPEQVWPQIKAFWLESGFTLASEDARVGVMETDWAENRAKIPHDFVRSALGSVMGGLYDTGERDRFHTRIERTENGSEVFISHHRLEEQVIDRQQDQLRWLPRPADPQLEAEFLSRLMVRLGGDEATARTALAAPVASAPARARRVDGQPTATVEFDEAFDRAWRRVGLALDRTGFTVEDRNRRDGLYFVRYVDGSAPGKDTRGLFTRLFGSSDEAAAAQRYRIALTSDANKTLIQVQTADGKPVPAAVGDRIAGVLVAELK